MGSQWENASSVRLLHEEFRARMDQIGLPILSASFVDGEGDNCHLEKCQKFEKLFCCDFLGMIMMVCPGHGPFNT
jgi:hypothetical protein